MSNTTLSAHLASLNAATIAWVSEDPANRGAFTCTEDLSYWNSIGVYTVDDFKRNLLESTVWDLYESVHGVRPRFMNLKEMSVDELQATIKSLDETAAWQAEMEEKYAAQQAIDDAWRAELDAHEATLCIPGELQFVRGAWAVA
jgi:hypothetical protein